MQKKEDQDGSRVDVFQCNMMSDNISEKVYDSSIPFFFVFFGFTIFPWFHAAIFRCRSRVTWPFCMHRERRRWFFNLSKSLFDGLKWVCVVSFLLIGTKLIYWANFPRINVQLNALFSRQRELHFNDEGICYLHCYGRVNVLLSSYNSRRRSVKP